MKQSRLITKREFLSGMHDGVPIGLGYFAVAFSLGIKAKQAGISAVESFVMSLLCNASAGEYAGIKAIGEHALLIELALTTLIINARYLLMSCALSQKLPPNTKLHHRLFIGFDITDEMFSIAIKRADNGFLNPYYYYGAMLTTIPMWASGTAIGVVAGEILPQRIVSALSVALFSMFLAVIIPPARKSKVILLLVAVSFLLSFLFTVLPYLCEISDGTKTIILTVVISAAAAVLFPRKAEDEEAKE